MNDSIFKVGDIIRFDTFEPGCDLPVAGIIVEATFADTASWYYISHNSIRYVRWDAQLIEHNNTDDMPGLIMDMVAM